MQDLAEFLRGKVYLGIVENVKDPKKLGRVKVRVQGIFENIELKHIPWASPHKSLDGKTFRIPSVGKIVNVVFEYGHLYSPTYMYCEHYNINLRDKLSSLSDDEYMNFVALLFDHRTQIYSDDSALTLDYLYNKLTITKKSMNMELKDNTQKINIGTLDADQQAVLGNHFFNWMDKFVRTLLIPTSLVGNLGVPVLKPQIDQLLSEYLSIRETFLSKHVNIVDNQKIKKLE